MSVHASKWIRDALNQTGRPQKGLARALGISEPQVSRLVAGKRRLRAAEIPLLEQYFGMTYPQSNSSTSIVHVLSPPQQLATLPVRVVISGGVWRERGSVVLDQTLVTASPDPRLADINQYCCRIDGPEYGSLIGQYVVCVPYRRLRLSPTDGDVVHVVRHKGELEEHTLRTVRVRDGVAYLAPYNSDAQSFLEIDDQTEIAGLVVLFSRVVKF